MLYVDRKALIVREKGEYVQYLEVVETNWEAGEDSTDDWNTEMGRMTVLRK